MEICFCFVRDFLYMSIFNKTEPPIFVSFLFIYLFIYLFILFYYYFLHILCFQKQQFRLLFTKSILGL